MTVRPLFASLCASLDDFLAKPLHTVAVSGASAVAILDANQPVFYVVSPDFWQEMTRLGQTTPPERPRRPAGQRRPRAAHAGDAQGEGAGWGEDMQGADEAQALGEHGLYAGEGDGVEPEAEEFDEDQEADHEEGHPEDHEHRSGGEWAAPSAPPQRVRKPVPSAPATRTTQPPLKTRKARAEPAPRPASSARFRSADVASSVLTQGAMRFNRFDALADQLIDLENQRVKRGELSAASVGILKNRLDAHVLPHFKYIPPSQVTPMMMDAFVQRLTDSRLSSTTVSQYLVVVRKLLKLAIRHGFLREIPELPSIKVASRPRSMLSLKEYAAVVRTAHRLSKKGDKAPELKASTGYRERFWVQPRHLTLPPDMAWVIRFMVNSFVRPGDLRQLKHKHVQVVRGTSVYLRMTLPQTKRHDAPMVTLRPAVQVYESALAQARLDGFGQPDDYVFLPAENDRNYALAVLGFWFKWVMREAGVASEDVMGRLRTLYCLRHTSIMFRLLYGQGIDMLTLARNARTSVQMIERFYASALDGEMNVAMLQSRRTSKS